jgi:Domain of unknown function (DUF5655)
MSLEEYFSTGPSHERPIYDVVFAFAETLGPVVVEPVAVGIFLKRSRTFAELRPMQKWVALCITLPSRVTHRCMTRKPIPYSGQFYCVFNLRSPADFDDRMQDWMALAYAQSPV